MSGNDGIEECVLNFFDMDTVPDNIGIRVLPDRRCCHTCLGPGQGDAAEDQARKEFNDEGKLPGSGGPGHTACPQHVAGLVEPLVGCLKVVLVQDDIRTAVLQTAPVDAGELVKAGAGGVDDCIAGIVGALEDGQLDPVIGVSRSIPLCPVEDITVALAVQDSLVKSRVDDDVELVFAGKFCRLLRQPVDLLCGEDAGVIDNAGGFRIMEALRCIFIRVGEGPFLVVGRTCRIHAADIFDPVDGT